MLIRRLIRASQYTIPQSHSYSMAAARIFVFEIFLEAVREQDDNLEEAVILGQSEQTKSSFVRSV